MSVVRMRLLPADRSAAVKPPIREVAKAFESSSRKTEAL